MVVPHTANHKPIALAAASCGALCAAEQVMSELRMTTDTEKTLAMCNIEGLRT